MCMWVCVCACAPLCVWLWIQPRSPPHPGRARRQTAVGYIGLFGLAGVCIKIAVDMFKDK